MTSVIFDTVTHLSSLAAHGRADCMGGRTNPRREYENMESRFMSKMCRTTRRSNRGIGGSPFMGPCDPSDTCPKTEIWAYCLDSRQDIQQDRKKLLLYC